jgi:surfeit locus 1 family protein
MPDIFSNPSVDKLLRQWLPPVGGFVFAAVFLMLGFWQLDRAAQKNATRAIFETQQDYRPLVDTTETRKFQAVSVNGRFLDDRQVLIDKVVKNGRVGYYVIAAFRSPSYTPLLVVNRGWVERAADGGMPADIALDPGTHTLTGKIGDLPKVGVRPGPVFDEGEEWPRKAHWPALPDLAAAWGEEVSPIVLLLDPGDSRFLRRWLPAESGPMTHYGYAAQWFAMAAAAMALLAWRLRRRFLARAIAAR